MNRGRYGHSCDNLDEEEDVDFEAEEASQALQDVLEVTSDI